MNKNGKKHFTDVSKLELLISLRRHGVSYDFIAHLFSCYKSSIIRQCRKWGVISFQGSYNPFRVLGEVINPPAKEKTYKEYIREQETMQNMHLLISDILSIIETNYAKRIQR